MEALEAGHRATGVAATLYDSVMPDHAVQIDPLDYKRRGNP